MPRLYPLFSGSSGNCYYLGSQEEGVLVDIGRSARQICRALQERSLRPEGVRAVLITHEHIDHVQGLRVFAGQYGVPVYASAGTVHALQQKGLADERTELIAIGERGVELDDMFIRPFAISHDCAQGYGYRIETRDSRSTSFVTDTGVFTPEMRRALSGSDTVVLESNHDEGMLRCGPYPYPLKQRILSEVGHLSNEASAQEAVGLVRSGCTRLLLAHLSRENNLPLLAEQTACSFLEREGMKRGRDYLLQVAGENGSSMMLY